MAFKSLAKVNNNTVLLEIEPIIIIIAIKEVDSNTQLLKERAHISIKPEQETKAQISEALELLILTVNFMVHLVVLVQSIQDLDQQALVKVLQQQADP